MKTTLLLASTLWLTSLAAAAQLKQDPLRNTFVTAAENVIDTATALDLKAEPATYDPRIAQLRTMKENLTTMAEGDSEHDVVLAVSDMLYTVQACRLQAVNGADVAPCLKRLGNATTRAMTALNKHKAAGAWLNGPPA